MGLLLKLWTAFKTVLGLILPAFAKARDFRGWSSQTRWTLHIILVVLILVGLGCLNYFAGVGVALSGPLLLRKYLWLPLLFLLVYLLSWLGWWLWKLLGGEEDTADFPDIDEAWDEAVRGLNQAGIDLSEAPLFVVLGQPAGGVESLFNAAQIKLGVKQAPARADAPIHLHANRDAIYVTCSGASLLARQAALLAGEDEGGGGVADFGGGSPEEDPNKTLRPEEGNPLQKMQLLLAQAEKQGRSPAQLIEEEKRELQQLARKSKSRPSLLKNTAEAEMWLARLRHLCHLIVRDRAPYCPANGILMLVPFGGTESDADADQTGAICQKELAAARQGLQVQCPVYALVCDLETTTGFREFLDHFAERDRQRRVGQRFPLAPDLDPASIPAKVDESVQWICQSVIPYWVYKNFHVETAGEEEMAMVVRDNARLYQFLAEARTRQKRLGRIVTRGVASEINGPLLYGGCYIAGTGSDASHEQAFVAGVFRRLTDTQNAVAWTGSAMTQDATYQRWATLGYVGLGIFVVIVAGIGYFIWTR